MLKGETKKCRWHSRKSPSHVRKQGVFPSPPECKYMSNDQTRFSHQIHSTKQCFTVHDLIQGITGSAKMVLCASAQVILTTQMSLQALETRVYGSIPKGSVEIILWRSSSALKGIKTLPEIIDYDYSGEIRIMIETWVGVLVIPRRIRIDQWVVLPMFCSTNHSLKQEWGDKGFCSTVLPGAS